MKSNGNYMDAKQDIYANTVTKLVAKCQEYQKYCVGLLDSSCRSLPEDVRAKYARKFPQKSIGQAVVDKWNSDGIRSITHFDGESIPSSNEMSTETFPGIHDIIDKYVIVSHMLNILSDASKNNKSKLDALHVYLEQLKEDKKLSQNRSSTSYVIFIYTISIILYAATGFLGYFAHAAKRGTFATLRSEGGVLQKDMEGALHKLPKAEEPENPIPSMIMSN